MKTKSRQLKDFRPFIVAHFKRLHRGGFAVHCGHDGCSGHFGQARWIIPEAQDENGEVFHGLKILHFELLPEFSWRNSYDGNYFAISKRKAARSARSKVLEEARLQGRTAMRALPNSDLMALLNTTMGWETNKDLSENIDITIARSTKETWSQRGTPFLLDPKTHVLALCPRCGKMGIIKAFTE